MQKMETEVSSINKKMSPLLSLNSQVTSLIADAFKPISESHQQLLPMADTVATLQQQFGNIHTLLSNGGFTLPTPSSFNADSFLNSPPLLNSSKDPSFSMDE